MYICDKCGKDFFEDWRIDTRTKKQNPIPRFCSKVCANSRIWSKEDKLKKSISASISEKVIIANKARRIYFIEKKCKICNTRISNSSTTNFCLNCYRKDHKEMSFRTKGKTGGLREGSGISKSGYYNGFYCSSTWELAYISFLIDNDIEFKRNLERFPYVKKDGIKSFYNPDFIVGENFVEIKGPQDLNWKEKLNAFPYKEKLIIIDPIDIVFYLQKAFEKFNTKKLYEIYDEYKPKYNHNCGFCKKDFSNDKKESFFCCRSCSGKNMALKNKSTDT